MSRLSILLAAAALLTACPGPAPTPTPPDAGDTTKPDAGQVDPPPPTGLLHLGGPLELAPGVPAPTNVRLAVLWFPTLDPSAPQAFTASESGPLLPETLPNRWSFDIQAEPPAQARSEVTAANGATGAISWGVVVAYRDVRADGQLSMMDGMPLPDVIVGSSAGAQPFDFDGPGVRTLVLWRQGTLGSDETGLEQGFNLVRMSEPFARPSVFPKSMDFTIALEGDRRLQLMACPQAFGGMPTEFACGQRVFRTPTVNAMAMSFEEGIQFATVTITAGPRVITDAVVTLNNVVIPRDTEGAYTLMELFPQALQRGANTLRVEAPQHEPVVLTLMFPEAPTLQAPQANGELSAGTKETVRWSAVQGATNYDVSLSMESGSGDYVSVEQPEAEVTVPDETGDATLFVGVMANTPVRRHSVIGTSSISVPVKIVR